MTGKPSSPPPLLLVPLLLVLAGCASSGHGGPAGVGDSQEEDVGDLSALMCPDGPTWEVDGSTEAPAVLNREVISQRLRREYNGPRRPGGMRVLVTARVTRGGTIDQVCIVESSGIPQFDRFDSGRTLGPHDS